MEKGTCPALNSQASAEVRHLLLLSHEVVSDSATPWTITCRAPLSMDFSRQQYWSGLLFSLPGDPPDPGIEPVSSTWADRVFTLEPPGKPPLGLMA